MSMYFTWGELGFLLMVVLIPYYACCALLFYWAKVKSVNSNQAGTIWKRQNLVDTTPSTSVQEARTHTDASFHSHIHELMHDLSKVFESAVTNELSKDQVLEAIQFRLANYSNIKETSFREVIENNIAQELQSNCGIFLKSEEIKKLW